jgi:hypothetical protein
MSPRRFPFGHEPVVMRRPEEPPSRMTEPLVGFAAPTRVLPFYAALPAPAAAPVPTPSPVVARPRWRRAVRAWVLVALAAMVVLDAVLLFLVVRGLR